MQIGYLAGPSAIQSSRRRWLITLMAFLLLTSLILIAPPARADFGTSLDVDITVPAAGSTFEVTESVTLEGTAEIGMGVAVKDTTVVYILDVSGSTGPGFPLFDCVGDSAGETVLECEKEAVRRVNSVAAGPNSRVLNSGLGVFSGSAMGSVEQVLTEDFSLIDSALSSLTPGGGTNFNGGLSAAEDILDDEAATANQIVVFLTDGDGSYNGSSPLAPEVDVKAFAIAGAGCSPNLVAISDSCEVVTDLSVLDEVIVEAIGSTLDSLTYSVDGGSPILLPSTPGIPLDGLAGPATLEFGDPPGHPIGQLPLGPHEICVTATGSDSGGTGTASDCVDFEVVQTAVDCAEFQDECVAVANDGDVSTATVVAPAGFDKQLGIRPVDTVPFDCGGDDCVTGYDVLFPDGDEVIIELTVVASRENSIPPGQAAAFIDGVEITDKCKKTASKSPIPCAKITRIKGGLTQYFWRVGADPRMSGG
jgi:hypothetical protein